MAVLSTAHQVQGAAICRPARAQRCRVVAAAAAAAPQAGGSGGELSRRQLLSAVGAAGLAAVAGAPDGGSLTAPRPAQALELAPLGPVERVGGEKMVGLTSQQVADILARNLREGQYFITGDLTPEIFDDQCVFKDPTNTTQGLSRYVKALGLLFDASYSAVQLADIRATGPRTIEADWKLGGCLKLPWNPMIQPVAGHTVYRLNEQGLIVLQDQTWSISAGKALAQTFTPTAGCTTDVRDQLLAA